MTSAQKGSAGLSTTSALADLIRSRMTALGASYRQAAAASQGHLTVAYVHKLAKGDRPRLPSRDTADGLAAALGVPAEVFIAAALADMRIGEFEMVEGKARAIYEEARRLTEQDQDILLNQIRLMRERPAPADRAAARLSSEEDEP